METKLIDIVGDMPRRTRANSDWLTIELNAAQLSPLITQAFLSRYETRKKIKPNTSTLAWVLELHDIQPVSAPPCLYSTDLPDIDIDFNDAKRDEVFTYLGEKYGAECVARIGNINTLKPRSVLAEVCKRFAIPDHERFNIVNVLIETAPGDARFGHGLEDTLATTAAGRAFVDLHPKAAVMGQAENHASHTGVHAAGVIVCNEPISNYCTVGADGIAQIDKPDAEALNLLKIDALGLSTLGIIEDAGVTTAEELYALKFDDPEVFRIFNDHKYAAVFQFEGHAQRSISEQISINDFRTLDHLTALSRPGPLGGGATGKYLARKRGEEHEVAPYEKHIAHILEETFGVVLYQEQVMRIVREVGGFSWEETAITRKAIGLRKGEEYFNQQGEIFIAGAARNGVPPAEAWSIWRQLCTFGVYGMNQSHTCSYAMISYWCAFLKRYHGLEYAASCLRHAKDDEQTLAILRELNREGVEYVSFDVDRSDANWRAVDGKLIGGFQNLIGIGPAKAAKAIENRNAGKMTDAARAKFLALPAKFAQLYPIRDTYRELHDDPEKFGCREGSVISRSDALPESGDVLMVGRVTKLSPRDENEPKIVARRGRRTTRGPTAFADLLLVDDGGVPIICRVGRYDFEPMGRVALERLTTGDDVVMIRGTRVPNFSMIRVERIKCLNNPDLLEYINNAWQKGFQ